MRKQLATRAAGSMLVTVALLTALLVGSGRSQPVVQPGAVQPPGPEQDALQMIKEGRQTFRFDTFGDEEFWGDALKLHHAVVGEKLGGVGPGVSPKAALAVGLKVDMNALPKGLVQQLQQKKVNLDDPSIHGKLCTRHDLTL